MDYSIYIIADSRGAFLQHFLDSLNIWPNVNFTVEVYKGSGILQLWARARHLLLSEEANFIYLFGGICDLTTKFNMRGRREFWIRKRPRDQIYDQVLLVNNICEEAVKLCFYGKLAFFQEIGCDLLKYNRVTHPRKWMLDQQADLDEWLPLLHREVKDINYKLGVRTPWILDSIYRHTNGRRFYPRYYMMHDGLHPTRDVACKIAEQVIKDVSEAHKE